MIYKHLIYGFFLVTILGGCNSNPGKTKAEKIAYVVEQAYKDKQFVGNVLVAEKGLILYKKSFGMSDAGGNTNNNDSTKFLIGSISKPITAIVILRLYDKGLIKLQDLVSIYVKTNNQAIGKITIHQLLTHSSGINEFINKEKNFDLNSALDKAMANFEPGSDFGYSNSGFVLLAKIAEKVTGKTFEDVVKTEVFGPADMTSSGVARNNKTAVFAKGYAETSQKRLVAVDFPFENIDGAGSLYATTEDLFKLDRALRSNVLLTEEAKALMLKPHIREKYAYGWFVRERGGLWDVYWHKGDLTGVTTYLSRRTQKDQLIVLLANAGNLDIEDIEQDLAKIMKE